MSDRPTAGVHEGESELQPPSPWRGGFASLEREIGEQQLEVDGSIPDWLEGTLVRNGPAKFEAGERGLNHWFDGLAMLHGFTIEGGEVAYANRFLETEARRSVEETGELAFGEFGTDPCRSIFERFVNLFDRELTDNASVNVARMADEVVALTETPIPVRLDPETLETRGRLDWDEQVEGELTTAHPHHDAERGRTVNYVTKLGRNSVYRVFAVPDGTARQELVAELDVDRPAYMHSFALTPNYVVLAEFPLVVDPLGLALSNEPLVGNFEWRPERGTRWLVFDRATGELVASPHGEAMFAFHHVNAYEEEGELVVDLCAYPDASIVDELFLDRVRTQAPGRRAVARPTRIRIGLEGGQVRQQRLADEALELPRTWYEAVNGQPYRYVYGVGHRNDPPREFLNQLVKLDVEEQTTQTWSQPGTFPGEPVFVPHPEAEAEDEGLLLSVAFDAESGRSFLLVLDAATMEERVRAVAPHHVPFGFHGSFEPAED